MRLVGLLITSTAITIASAQGYVPDHRRDPAATRLLVERAVLIKPGEPRASVLRKLGVPDLDRELFPKVPNKPKLGRSMTYDIVKDKGGGVNEIHDQYVTVYRSERCRGDRDSSG